jgi:glycosyltransferase involved in cell wall biosynthesis
MPDSTPQPPRLCRTVSVPTTFATLLRRQIAVVAANNIVVTLVSSAGGELESISHENSMTSFPVPMARAITPFRDLRSLLRLYRYFRCARFDIVHSSTPKAGLLTALASWCARVPIRLHTYTGQPWVEMRGLKRFLARSSDKLVGTLTTGCYADSASQRRFLIENKIVDISKIAVLASGSLSGVDLDRFDPKIWRNARSAETRAELGISTNALALLFLGRITRDKGIVELYEAFCGLQVPGRDIELILVGPFEPERDPLPPATLAGLSRHAKIHMVGFTPCPERYLGVADIFCLPSYREGFGSAVIEAAAMGVPAVATSVVGLVDAVVPGETGLLVPPKDAAALRIALTSLLVDSRLRQRLGNSAQIRARLLFDAAKVNQAVADEYWRLYRRAAATQRPRPAYSDGV